MHFNICVNSKSKLFKIPLSHGKIRKACNLYKSCFLSHQAALSLTPQIVPEGMRFIEDLRNEYVGSEIWIIGSDPNVDFYPDDFFEDKLSITVNISCAAFPESTFFMFPESRDPEKMKSMRSDRKSILPLEFLGVDSRVGPWENWGLNPIYMKLEAKYYSSSSPDYEPMANQIFGNRSCEFTLPRTTVHFAIYAAAVLGAKKIILVGCSHKISDETVYAQKRGIGAANILGKIRTRANLQTYGRMRRDTKELARVFKKYGVEIVRHRYDEGRSEFMFEEIKR